MSARVFNQQQSSGGAQGLAVTGVPPAFGIGKDESALLQGVRQNADFRYNIFLVETTGKPVALELTVSDGSVEVARASYILQAYEHQLLSVGSLAPGATIADGVVRLRATTGEGKAVALGSLIAASSQDSTRFEMSFSATVAYASQKETNGVCQSFTPVTATLYAVEGSEPLRAFTPPFRLAE